MVLAVAFAVAAFAESRPGVTVTPKRVGSGSVLTFQAKLPQHGFALRGFRLRLVRGFKVAKRAVAERCRPAQAARTHKCPADSRIGGGEAKRITPDAIEARRPTWSPDSRALAFQGFDDGWHIYAIGVDGSGLRPLTTGPFDDQEPDWSRDGRRIAFSSDRFGGIP